MYCFAVKRNKKRIKLYGISFQKKKITRMKRLAKMKMYNKRYLKKMGKKRTKD